MTQVVTVQTDFADLNQMTQGLLERVHETHVILTGPEDISEGEWVQFAINLQDGTPGFAGLGRCVRSVDNGEARLPHQRYDLVLDSLQFDQHGQDVYQYILMSRQALQSPESAELYGAEEPSYADDDGYAQSGSSYAEVADDDVDSLPAAAPDEAADEPYDEEATRVESARKLADERTVAEAIVEDGGEAESSEDEVDFYLQSDAPLAEVAPTADYQAPAAIDEGEFGAAPEPVPPGPPQERRFVYTNGLPIPDAPPRPDLDPSLRVTPAPRPSTPSTAPRLPDDGIDPFEQARSAAARASRNGSAHPIDVAPDEAELEPVSIEPEPMEDESRSV